MKLHEYGTDQLLELLEKTQQGYHTAKAEASRAEFNFERMSKTTASAKRKALGLTIDDAKAAALDDPAVLNAFEMSVTADLKKDEAMGKLERVRTAIDLWRSEQASLRRV